MGDREMVTLGKRTLGQMGTRVVSREICWASDQSIALIHGLPISVIVVKDQLDQNWHS